MDLDSVLVHKHTKEELGEYPAILTSHLVKSHNLIANIIDLLFNDIILKYSVDGTDSDTVMKICLFTTLTVAFLFVQGMVFQKDSSVARR